MWPFSRWRKAREKAFIREAFEQYIAPDLLEALIKNPGGLSLSAEKRRVIFALLQFRDDDPTVLSQRLKTAADIAIDAQGMVDFMPPFLMVAFGIPLTDKPENLLSLRQRMIENLLSSCGRDIRILYGEADALVGNLGSERRFTYGAVIPRLGAAFQRLMTLEFGVASEVVL